MFLFGVAYLFSALSLTVVLSMLASYVVATAGSFLSIAARFLLLDLVRRRTGHEGVPGVPSHANIRTICRFLRRFLNRALITIRDACWSRDIFVAIVCC